MLDLSNPQNWSQLWLIGIVVFEDLLRIAGIVAVGYVIYGGINYQTSQGEPENTHRARQTITNAMIGVVIAVLGSAAVNFIGNRLGG
jgi:hypothetical protein